MKSKLLQGHWAHLSLIQQGCRWLCNLDGVDLSDIPMASRIRTQIRLSTTHRAATIWAWIPWQRFRWLPFIHLRCQYWNLSRWSWFVISIYLTIINRVGLHLYFLDIVSKGRALFLNHSIQFFFYLSLNRVKRLLFLFHNIHFLFFPASKLNERSFIRDSFTRS